MSSILKTNIDGDCYSTQPDEFWDKASENAEYVEKPENSQDVCNNHCKNQDKNYIYFGIERRLFFHSI